MINSKKAFSFIEVIIASSIIVIISVVAATNYSGMQDKTTNSKILSDIQTLNNYLINTDLGKTDTIETLQCKISIARCARLSYQTLGDNPVIDYEKDLALYESLSTSGHWSPFEHVAKAMTDDEYHSWCKGKIKVDTIEEAITIDNLGWCRNYRGFIMYRELLD